jgi:hypothetical protein
MTDTDKIVFLDIDGVLNTDLTKERTPTYYINTGWGMQKRRYTGIEPYKVDILIRILRETGAKLVLSSTWRHHEEMQDYMWKQLGKEVKERYIGDTPVEPGCAYRGKEIYDYLQLNPYKNFVILDDDLSVKDYFHKEFIETNPYKTGLTDELADKAIKLLNGEKI